MSDALSRTARALPLAPAPWRSSVVRVGALIALGAAVLAAGGTADATARDGRRDRTGEPASTMLPPLPKPHPHRASPSRKASTARAAALAEAERAADGSASSRNENAAAAATPPPPRPRPDVAAPVATPLPQPLPDVAAKPPPAAGPAAGAAASAVPPPPPAWTAAEIETAARECDELLASTGAEAELQPPLRQGECGTPAPLKVSRIGSGDGIRLEPAGVLNCRMVARLHQWLETVAQPAARAAFGARIAKLANASAYMCRNRYNDAAAKISEHAFANALDVSAFVLADGRRIDVKTYWGPLAATTAALQQPAPTANGRPTDLERRAVTAGLDAGAPKNTGTPPPQQPAATATAPPTAEQQFLRGIHDAACGIFTTVLGPEANAAHHDHFHLDLQKRRSTAYCQ